MGTLDEVPLRERAAAKGILFGGEAMAVEFAAEPIYGTKFTQDCQVLVPGNELKWAMLRPTPKTFNFAQADSLDRFARAAGIKFRGHTLVWGDALPPWVAASVTKRTARRVMNQHIRVVASRYAGRMHSWDVVNEPVLPWDGRSDRLQNNLWFKTLGPEYIRIAFEQAALADPRALLVLNQNYLEYEGAKWTGFRSGTLRLLERLRAQGAPVHALGIQAHLQRNAGYFNEQSFRSFLRDVAAMGLEIVISELDVLDTDLPASIDECDRLVADQYERFLDVALDEPAVKTVVTWGFSDKYSWYRERGSTRQGKPVRPLLLDDRLEKKPSWYAVARAFDGAPSR